MKKVVKGLCVDDGGGNCVTSYIDISNDDTTQLFITDGTLEGNIVNLVVAEFEDTISIEAYDMRYPIPKTIFTAKVDK